MRARITDRDRFARLWKAGLPKTAIAAEFGVSDKAVTTAAIRFELPPRGGDAPVAPRPKGRPRAEAGAAGGDAVCKGAPVSRQVTAMSVRVKRARAKGVLFGADLWAADRDARIIETGGRYEPLHALARRWGMPASRVVARWHNLRGV